MEYVFTLTEADANTVIQGLYELPVKVALPIIQKIQKQAQDQQIKEPPKE